MVNASERLTHVVDNILGTYFRPAAGTPVVILFDAEKAQLAQALRLGLAMRGHRIHELRTLTTTAELETAVQNACQTGGQGLMVLGGMQARATPGVNRWHLSCSQAPTAQCACTPVFYDCALAMPTLLRLFSAPPADIDRYLAGIRDEVAAKPTVHITASDGTSLKVSVPRWEVRNWTLTACPVPGSVEGTVVVDGGVFFGPVRRPIVMVIQDGRLSELLCDDPTDPVFRHYVRAMAEARDENGENWQVAAVGFGGNPNAEVGEGMVESLAARDTLHLCFGDNSFLPELGGTRATGWHGGTVIVRAPEIVAKGS